MYTDKEQNGFDYNNKKVALLQKKFFSNKNSVVFRKKLRLTMAGRSKILRFKYNISDRLSILYTAMFKIPTHTYKIFSMLELQLCSLAVRGRLVPYTFMVYELCFYRIFFVNQKTISDSFYVLGLYDTLQIPVFLYRYFFYKHLGFQFLPEVLMQFFKKY